MNSRYRATGVVLVWALVSVPLVQAHTTTFEYDLPSGVMKGTPSVSTRPCATEWHDWGGLTGVDAVDDTLTTGTTAGCRAVDPEEDGVVRIGVYHAVAETDGHEHRTWTITATDTLGERPYLVACDTYLGPCSLPIDVVRPHAEGCGSVSLTFPEAVPPSAIQVWVYAFHAEPDSGAVCLASKGELTFSGSD